MGEHTRGCLARNTCRVGPTNKGDLFFLHAHVLSSLVASLSSLIRAKHTPGDHKT
jgi:hypothetical protein